MQHDPCGPHAMTQWVMHDVRWGTANTLLAIIASSVFAVLVSYDTKPTPVPYYCIVCSTDQWQAPSNVIPQGLEKHCLELSFCRPSLLPGNIFKAVATLEADKVCKKFRPAAKKGFRNISETFGKLKKELGASGPI